jgi:hypothetical protein
VVKTEELERRMRPRAYSSVGFLGEDERLEDVLEADRQTLAALALTSDELAGALELLLGATHFALLSSAYEFEQPQHREELQKAVELAEASFGPVETRPVSIELEGRHLQVDGVLVGERLEVGEIGYFGWQECPWGPGLRDAKQGEGITLCGHGSSDWFITDVRRGLSMNGPSLITHLIREHGFFEGFESPYRVDPRALAELLQVGPFSVDG